MESQAVGVKAAPDTRVVERSQVAYRVALLVLVVGSLGLRMFGLGWGVPNFNAERMPQSAYRNSYHLDEDNFIWGLMQMRPSEGNFDVVDYHWGTLQHFLIYGTLLAGEAVGIIPSPWETAFRDGDIQAIGPIYELGRLVSVIAGVAGVLVVVALGTLLGGRTAGLGAGVAYALAPLAVVEAHYLTNDVLMSVLVTAFVLVCALAVKRHRPGLLIVAGLLLGLAVADKYSAIFAAPALLAAQWFEWRSTKYQVPNTESRTSLLGTWVLPWVVTVVGFLIGEPYALIVPDKLLAGIQSTLDGNAMDAAWGLEPPFRMITWQLGNLGWLGLTLPMALLALSGLAVIVWRVVRRKVDDGTRAASIILLVAMLGIVLGLGLNRVFVLRYSQPLVPLLAVVAGVGWAAIPRAGLRWATGAVTVAVAGVVTAGQLSLMAGPHPANQLLAWLDSHIKPGQEVARLWPEYPPLDGGDIRLIRLDPWRPAMPEGANPDYIVMDNMMLGPPDPALTELIDREYKEVANFGAQPSIGPITWDEGTTPHDWKYSHPAFVVYEKK